jgi:hypothetical protein
MPTFTTLALTPEVPAGAHLGKIVKAVERVSERGNQMIVMTIELPPPDRQRLACTITFVPAARALVNAFCSSAGLVKPIEPDIEVELGAAHCLGRYLYFKIELDEDGAPRISRFIGRETALQLNPRLAEVKTQPQAPVVLPIVRKPSL